VIEFLRRRGDTGLTYTPEACSALTAGGPDGWQPMTAEETVVPIDADWERVIVEDSVTVGTHPRRFLRLRIEESP